MPKIKTHKGTAKVIRKRKNSALNNSDLKRFKDLV